MDIWILVAAIVASGSTLVALLFWGITWDNAVWPDLDNPDFSAAIGKAREGQNVGYWPGTVLGAAFAFIWIWITGFHWNVVAAFVWPYAMGYIWASGTRASS